MTTVLRKILALFPISILAGCVTPQMGSLTHEPIGSLNTPFGQMVFSRDKMTGVYQFSNPYLNFRPTLIGRKPNGEVIIEQFTPIAYQPMQNSGLIIFRGVAKPGTTDCREEYGFMTVQAAGTTGTRLLCTSENLSIRSDPSKIVLSSGPLPNDQVWVWTHANNVLSGPVRNASLNAPPTPPPSPRSQAQPTRPAAPRPTTGGAAPSSPPTGGSASITPPSASTPAPAPTPSPSGVLNLDDEPATSAAPPATPKPATPNSVVSLD